MESVLAKKNTLQNRLKSGSMVITVVCALAMLFNLGVGIVTLVEYNKYGHDALTRFAFIRNSLASIIGAVIMGLAALMFLRISRNGIPFTDKNVRTVRVIAVLIIVNSFFPVIVSAAASGTDMGNVMVLGSMLSPTALAEGLLFLFTAYIIRYGTMLQQESDETL